MSENVKKIRELADFDVNTEISRDDLLIIATGPDGRRDKDGNTQNVAPSTVKATIDAVMQAYNASIIPPIPAPGVPVLPIDPRDRPGVPIPNPDAPGQEIIIDVTPINAANLDQIVGSGCGITVTDVCHDESEVLVDCSPLANVKYKTKKLCLNLGANSDLEFDTNGNIKIKSGAGGGTPTEDWIAPGGGLKVENGKLSVESSAESFNFLIYINANTGKDYSDIDASDTTSWAGFTQLNDKFKTFSDAINWIKNNIGSSRGRSSIVLETDCNSSNIHVPSYVQEILVWGNKQAFLRTYDGNASDPGNAETRKKITFTAASGPGNFNNIPVWIESKMQFGLIKLGIHSNSVSAGLFRCLGGRVDLVGARIIQEDNNSPAFALQSVNKGFIRVRPFQATWRSGTDMQDPFNQNVNLAALELENIKTNRVFDITQSSRLSIIEYAYRSYDTNDPATLNYTWNARVHFVNVPTSARMINIDNFSVFESNGIGFTIENGLSYAPGDHVFMAKAFNTITAGGTQPMNTLEPEGAASLMSKFPNGNYIGTQNTDYIMSPAFVQGALDQVSSYPV